MEQNLLIIDTDCGIDDAVAILYALTNPEWNVLAITCCSGNTELKHVCSNVLRVLKLCGKDKVPVYAGCSTSLLSFPLDSKHYHGEDGFGGVSTEFSTGDLQIQDSPASCALTKLAKDHQGAITLISLGPLTNLAIAQRLDPQFFANLKQLSVMGGNTQGRGNITIASEFNFACDPEAAHVVLEEAPKYCSTLIIPWETCLGTYIPWDIFRDCLKVKNAKSDLVNKIYEKAIQQQLASYRPGFVCCDFIAMVALMNPRAILSEKQHPVYVELQGKYTRGMLVIETRPHFMKDKASSMIVFEMDTAMLTNTFSEMLHA